MCLCVCACASVCACACACVCVPVCMCIYHQDLCAYIRRSNLPDICFSCPEGIEVSCVCVFVISTHPQGLTPPFHMHTDLGDRSTHTQTHYEHTHTTHTHTTHTHHTHTHHTHTTHTHHTHTHHTHTHTHKHKRINPSFPYAHRSW